MSRQEYRNYVIFKFIQENEPCTFNNITEYLKKIKESYHDSSGLSKFLNKFEDVKIIKDRKAKPHPTYSIIQDYSLDVAMMGDLFRQNFINPFFTNQVEIKSDYLKNDIPLESWDSLDEKFVKTMVTRYGFYMLSMLVKAYEQSITRKHFNRKIWIQNAIDLMKDETLISESFLSLLDLPFDYPKEKNSIYQDEFELDDTLDIDKHPELDYNPKVEGYPEYSELETDNKLQIQELNLTKRKNKLLLKNKLKNVKTAMENIYPKLYKNIRYYEGGVEKQPEKIKSKFIAHILKEKKEK